MKDCSLGMIFDVLVPGLLVGCAVWSDGDHGVWLRKGQRLKLKAQGSKGNANEKINHESAKVRKHEIRTLMLKFIGAIWGTSIIK